MEARTKKDFFQLLIAELNRIGVEDTAEITADFEGHFIDSAANGLSEEEACRRLGDIKEIARNYLNLESSRINSMVARDVERKKISLTKPGKSVPADLSLMSARDAANSDNIREYTPEHISAEIYPNSVTDSNSANTGFVGGTNGNFTQNTNSIPNQTSGNNNSANANNNSAGTAQSGQTVADAFSNAGKAVADAAKVTGHAIADAFSNSGVKDAVIDAGKSAANAVKTAGHSAANAVSKAKSEHEQRRAQGVPQPNDDFRDNNTSNRCGTIPPQHTKAKTKGGYKLIDVSTMKPDLNVGKLAIALVLDFCLWIWLVFTILGFAMAIFCGGAKFIVYTSFSALFGRFGTVFPTNIFLFTGFFSLGLALICVGVWVVKLMIRLVVFIINMHIKAIYNI